MVKSFFRNIRNKLKRLAGADKKNAEKPVKKKDDHGKAGPVTPKKSKNRIKKTNAKKYPPKTSSQKRKRRPKRRIKEPKTQKPASFDWKKAHERWDASQYDIPPARDKVRFTDLDIPDRIIHAIADLGFQYCSPIQAEILPATLSGRDASGQAQTGTGKTAAFLITILSHLLKKSIKKRSPGTPRAMIMAPTRELAMQISEEARLLAKYTDINIVTIFGGMDYKKQRRLITENIVDIVVATPGRLIDFCQYKDVLLDKTEILVIDEADRMLDMGFIPQVRQLVRKTPYKDKRQTMLFSATMTGDVERLSSQWTKDPIIVEIEPEQIEVASVEQLVYLITTKEKFALLYNLIVSQNLKRVIIFCNRRDETHRVADMLNRYNVKCAVISGEVPQKKRMRTLENFRSGNVRVLVATDVAGRGLHIEGISHVINYTLPHDPENYVHRIGRTGRAGATGTSISFACEEDSFYIPEIEKFLGHNLPCTYPDDDWLKLPSKPAQNEKPGKKRPKRRRRKRKRRPRPEI